MLALAAPGRSEEAAAVLGDVYRRLGIAAHHQESRGASARDSYRGGAGRPTRENCMNFSLRCHLCGTTFPATALWVCDQCLGPLEVTYDYAAIAPLVSRAADRVAPEEPVALSRVPADRATSR